ncbi:MAG: magnesium transporter CorA family protein [Janthinobacterium lividum]
MTTVVRPGPAPLSRVWTPRGVIAEDLQGEDLGDVLEMHSDAYAWWVLPKGDGYGERELRGAAEAMGLDSLVVKDLLAQDGRAKFEEVGPARIITTNTVALDRERVELRSHPMSVVVTDRILICLVDPTPEFRPADLFTSHADLLTTGGTDAALRELMIAVVNTYENVVAWMEESSDTLAARLFALEPLSRPEQLRAFRLRTVLSQLRRVTDPMRTVLTDAAANPSAPVGKKTSGGTQVRRRWTMIDERHTRVANSVDALRESLQSVVQTSLSLSDAQGNDTMKKLSGWAAIIAVPTLVSGFVGMNVAFPLESTRAGFWIALGLMVVVAVVLYVVFRIKRWV